MDILEWSRDSEMKIEVYWRGDTEMKIEVDWGGLKFRDTEIKIEMDWSGEILKWRLKWIKVERYWNEDWSGYTDMKWGYKNEDWSELKLIDVEILKGR